MHVILQTFGARVREARQRRGWSQEQLAEAAELDRTYLSGIERGVRNPTLVTMERLAHALGVEVGVLLRSETDEGTSS